MPYRLERTERGTYRVRSPSGVKAKGTTLRKAKRQLRLLRAIEHNPSFRPRNR